MKIQFSIGCFPYSGGSLVGTFALKKYKEDSLSPLNIRVRENIIVLGSLPSSSGTYGLNHSACRSTLPAVSVQGGVCLRPLKCACVRVCVCAGVRVCESECVCTCALVCVCARVRVCVCACVRVCTLGCLCARTLPLWAAWQPKGRRV